MMLSSLIFSASFVIVSPVSATVGAGMDSMKVEI